MPELQLGAAVRWGAEPAPPAYPGSAHSGWPLSIKKYQVGYNILAQTNTSDVVCNVMIRHVPCTLHPWTSKCAMCACIRQPLEYTGVVCYSC